MIKIFFLRKEVKVEHLKPHVAISLEFVGLSVLCVDLKCHSKGKLGSTSTKARHTIGCLIR